MRRLASLRRVYAGLVLLACTSLPAQGAELALPCLLPDGKPAEGTIVKALHEDGKGDVLMGTAKDGICTIEMPAGSFWVKAEAPGVRSVNIRVTDAVAPGRELRLVPVKGSDAEWQQALSSAIERDQAVRRSYMEAERQGDAARKQQAMKAWGETDMEHRAQLGKWLETRGFPSAAVVGQDGVYNIWLLLQHAPEIMALHMPALRAATAAGELSRASLALSEDRINLMQGRTQRYGSQAAKGPDGKFLYASLESREKVDVWRAEMDLGPLAVYLKQFGL